MSESESVHTCLNCTVKFKDADAQRDHYKTDWHRYNLKRRVAELPPVTAEEFQRRVIQQRVADEQALQETTLYCSACRKQFISDKSYDNHLNSKKHKDNALRFEKENEGKEGDVVIKQTKTVAKKEDGEPETDEDGEIEEIDSDQWSELYVNPIEENDCMFCSQHSDDLSANLQHMAVAHSFFVPDMDYVVDLNGLMVYLGEKIAKGEVFFSYICHSIESEEGGPNHYLPD